MSDEAIVLQPKEFSLRITNGDVMIEATYSPFADGESGRVLFAIFYFLKKSQNFIVSSFKGEQHFIVECQCLYTFDEFEEFVAKIIDKFREEYEPDFLTVDKGK